MGTEKKQKHASTYNTLVVAFSMVGSILVGYASGIIASTLGQVSWYKEMGLPMLPTEPGYSRTVTIESAVNGTFYAFCFIGTLFISEVMNRLGRIRAFQFAVFWHILGAAIQAGSVNQAMFLVGRAVTGFATGTTTVIGPSYLSEVAPPMSRGLMAGMHGCGQNTGYMISAWVGFGASYASPTSSFGFRFPLACTILIALILLGATFWIPESPRWLVSRGRLDEAGVVLARLHGGKVDSTTDFAHRELVEIEKQLAADKERLGDRSEFGALFLDRNNLKRVGLAVLVCSGCINTGVLVINNYAVIIYTSLGTSNQIALMLSALWLTLGMVYNYTGAYFSDRVGRKRCLLIGNSTTTMCLVLFTAMYAQFQETGNTKYATAALVFNFLFELCFGTGIDPHVWTVAAEVFPSHIRAKGSAIAFAMFYVYNVIWTEAAPTGFQTIGWKFYLIFICIQCVQTTLIYFFLPETANVPLEEMDDLFGGKAAVHLKDDDLITPAPAVEPPAPEGEKPDVHVWVERRT